MPDYTDKFGMKQTEDSNFSNILDLLINCATFIYIGATMPFDSFNDAMLTLKAWRLAVLGICVLLVRRLPAMLALYKFIPDIKTFREAIFAGFFGPMVSRFSFEEDTEHRLIVIWMFLFPSGRRSYFHCDTSTLQAAYCYRAT